MITLMENDLVTLRTDQLPPRPLPFANFSTRKFSYFDATRHSEKSLRLRADGGVARGGAAWDERIVRPDDGLNDIHQE